MNPENLKTRVGIFGGSFDPVHKGHVAIARSFLESRLVDQLLILPAAVAPHKKDAEQTPFHHRFEMLKQAFSKTDRVKISDLEAALPEPSYTLQTLRYLKDHYPGTVFFLCLGEDSLQAFSTWHRYKDILEWVPLLAARRPGFDSAEADPEILERTIFIDHKPIDISSTGIRNRVNEQLLPREVVNYIRKHKLYP